MNSLFDVLPTYILCGSTALTYSSPVCYNALLASSFSSPLSLSRNAGVCCSGGKVIVVEHRIPLKPFQLCASFVFPSFSSFFNGLSRHKKKKNKKKKKVY